MPRPIIGITCDLVVHDSGRPVLSCAAAYAECVARAGGSPILLHPDQSLLHEQRALCRGFVLTGGGDPRTEPFGVPTHPAASLVHPQRQAYETALIASLLVPESKVPTLGICLGMQMLCLVSGGTLDQHLPESLPTHDRHRNADHAVAPVADLEPRWRELLPPGLARSNHRQAITSTGTRFAVAARADDGVVEAVVHTAHPWCLGVQWHPERTANPALGQGLFSALVAQACSLCLLLLSL